MPMRSTLNLWIGLSLAAFMTQPTLGQDAPPPAGDAAAVQGDIHAPMRQLYQIYSAALPQLDHQIAIPDVPANDPHREVFTKLKTERDQACATCHVGTPTPNHKMLGLSLVPADDTLRDQLKLEKRGLVVTTVDPNSSSARGGVKDKDILVEARGKLLLTVDDFAKSIKDTGPGADLPVRLIHDGEPRDVKIPSPYTAVWAAGTHTKQPAPEPSYWIGVSIDPADATLRGHLKLTDDVGLVVTQVIKDTPAEKAGILKNDVLMTINSKPLKVAEDMVKIVKEAKETPVKIRLLRAGTERTVLVKPTKRSEGVEVAQTFAFTYPQMHQDGLFLLQNPAQTNWITAAQAIAPRDQQALLMDVDGALNAAVRQHTNKMSNEQLAAVVEQLNDLLSHAQKPQTGAQRAPIQPAAPGGSQTGEQERQRSLERIDAQLTALDGQIKELKAAMDSLRGTIKEREQDRRR
jgi:membrane-associated protease RseP (regulator of RpoE activity)